MNENSKPDFVSRFFLLLIAIAGLGLLSHALFKGGYDLKTTHEYAIVTIDGQGKFNFNGNGSIGLSGAQLVDATKFVSNSNNGWQIHSVFASPGGYVVVAEK